jgi:hypothetical protein
MTSKQQLLDRLSEYIDASLKDQATVIEQVKHQAQQEISAIKHQAQEEISAIKHQAQQTVDNARSEAAKEIAIVKSKLQALVQTEDNNKFQKRTIASLNAEISTMQSTITALEKRLKLATEEVRSLKKKAPVALSAVPSNMKEEVHHEPESGPERHEPEPERGPEPELDPEPEPERGPDSEDEGPQLIPLVLQSGVYFWDPDTNELYEFISDDEAGQVVSMLKSIKIKNEVYYLDPQDSSFYEVLEGGDVGERRGQIVDRKAIFNGN